MQHTYTLLLLLFTTLSVRGQIVTTDPAVPRADEEVTITFDATQGTAGLQDCGCDVYLHTGVILPGSSEWQNVQTTWAVEDDDWKLTPVEGESNLYTYTFTPTLREYFDVAEGTDILQLALVFRNGDGSLEGKAAGGADIFIDVVNGADLVVNLNGDPGEMPYALGRILPVTVGASESATLRIFANDSLVATGEGEELTHDLRLLRPGDYVIRGEATADGQTVSDSFTVTGELMLDVLEPTNSVVTATAGQSVNIEATSYVTAELTIRNGDQTLATTTDTLIDETLTLPAGQITTYTITATYLGQSVSRTVTYVTGAPTVAEVPVDARPGVTVQDNGDLLFVLRAPGKSDVFVVGNFNDYSPTAASRMTRTPDDSTFWLTLPAADLPEDNLLYQYAIDDQGRFADPYSTLVLDPNNDRFISEEVFAGIPAYPTGQAEGIISWLRLDAPDYDWAVEDFDRPNPERMVVYELLIRDFLEDHSLQSLTDTLAYLDRLGINTIELMPVNEFEGNISWGYNPSFHMALDKYYGAPEDLKEFVDSAHARGIAVVLDVVYNHAFGESPLIRIWPGAQPFEPGADNPYANVTARHPFNVGYDLNHESDLTQEYVNTTMTYWLEEFRVDGFRFDLSKGFTQNDTGNDVAAWNAYDASRIAIIKDYADRVWAANDSAYVILEHLGEEREEEELAQYGNGMYFWSGFNPHDAYLQASMGYDRDDLRPALSENRGFSDRSLIAYMESHDEERMMYKNLSFGNSAGDYDVRELGTALDRVELASALFYTLPGPKMLWQFGELGYDYSINYCQDGRIDEGCRTDPKPIVWEYREQEDRQDVYNMISDLLYLRNNFEFFHGTITAQQLDTGAVKYVHLDSEDGQAAVFGNFGVTAASFTSSVPDAGTWYDYLSGDSLQLATPDMEMVLAPGEYRVLLSRNIAAGGEELETGTNDRAVARLRFTAYPNPTAGQLTTTFTLERPAEVTVSLLDLMGRPVRQLFRGQLGQGAQSVEGQVSGLPTGTYFLRLTSGAESAIRRIVVR